MAIFSSNAFLRFRVRIKRVTVRCYRQRMKITGSDCFTDNSNCCNSGKYSPGLRLRLCSAFSVSIASSGMIMAAATRLILSAAGRRPASTLVQCRTRSNRTRRRSALWGLPPVSEQSGKRRSGCGARRGSESRGRSAGTCARRCSGTKGAVQRDGAEAWPAGPLSCD